MENENLSLFFQAGTFAIVLSGFICSFLWFVLGLKIKPLSDDVTALKHQVGLKLKSEDELKLFIWNLILKHKEECNKVKEHGDTRALKKQTQV